MYSKEAINTINVALVTFLTLFSNKFDMKQEYSLFR